MSLADFISTEDLSVFMSGAELDGAIAALAVAAAQQSVRKYMDQTITRIIGDIVDLDGTGRVSIRLPQRPVISITAVEVDGNAVINFLRRDSLLIRMDGQLWPRGVGNITIEYDHGWCVGDIVDSDDACETVPADIILVTLVAARRAYEAAGTDDRDGLTGETIGNYEWRGEALAAADLTKTERRVLDRYRIKGVK